LRKFDGCAIEHLRLGLSNIIKQSAAISLIDALQGAIEGVGIICMFTVVKRIFALVGVFESREGFEVGLGCTKVITKEDAISTDLDIGLTCLESLKVHVMSRLIRSSLQVDFALMESAVRFYFSE